MEQLKRFYKQNITMYALVYQYMLFYYVVVIIMFLGNFLWFAHHIFRFYHDNAAAFLTLNNASFLFLQFLCVYLFNNAAKRTVKSRYGIVVSGMLFQLTPQLERHQVKLLREYLEEQNLLSGRKINTLIRLLKEESQRRKIPSYVNPAIFVTLALSIWNNIVDKLFLTNVGINTIWLLLLCTFYLYVCSIIINLIKHLVGGFWNAAVPSKGNILAGLTVLLEMCTLELPEGQERAEDIASSIAK